MLAFLLLVAVLQKGGAKHPNAEAVQRRAASELAHLLAEDFRLIAREPSAAILTRPFRHSPAALGHPLHPKALRVGLELPFASPPARIFFAARRLAHLGRAVGFKPGAGLFAKGFEVGHR